MLGQDTYLKKIHSKLFSFVVNIGLNNTGKKLGLLRYYNNSNSSFKTGYDNFNMYCWRCYLSAFGYLLNSYYVSSL